MCAIEPRRLWLRRARISDANKMGNSSRLKLHQLVKSANEQTLFEWTHVAWPNDELSRSCRTSGPNEGTGPQIFHSRTKGGARRLLAEVIG